MNKPRLKRTTLQERANEARRLDSLPQNPIRSNRLALNLSHSDYADLAGISKQAVIRAEQGCYEEIPPSLLRCLMEHSFSSELQARDAYDNYRTEMRRLSQRYFGIIAERDRNPLVHPFTFLCLNNKVNPTQVAKDLCLSQATLSHWVKKWRTQQSVPRPFIRCLRDLGYTLVEIRAFELYYRDFRKAAKDAVI